MSLEEAKKLYEKIGEDESLRKEVEGLESEEEIIDKALEVAGQQGFEISREDLEDLLEELAEQSGELDEEELENVAGGNSSRALYQCMKNTPV